MVVLLVLAFGQIPGNVLVFPEQSPAKRTKAGRITTIATEQPVRVSIVGAKAGVLEAVDGKRELLQISVKIENVDPALSLVYHTWNRKVGIREPMEAAAGLKPLKPATLAVGISAGGLRNEEIIRPRRSVTDVIVFEMPDFSHQEITLSLSQANLQREDGAHLFSEDYFRVSVPRSMWIKSLKTVDPTPDDTLAGPVVGSIDGVKATVVSAKIQPVTIEEAAGLLKTEPYFLVIKLKVENTGFVTKEFIGWGPRRSTVTAKADDGTNIPVMDCGIGRRVQGDAKQTSLKVDEHLETFIITEPPSRTVKSIDVLLSRNGFPETRELGDLTERENLRLTIPASMWGEYFRRDDEARNKAVEKMKPAKKGD